MQFSGEMSLFHKEQINRNISEIKYIFAPILSAGLVKMDKTQVFMYTNLLKSCLPLLKEAQLQSGHSEKSLNHCYTTKLFYFVKGYLIVLKADGQLNYKYI